MIDANMLWASIVVGAGLGGMLSSIVGYYGSNEPFSPRKFAAAIIRGFFSGLITVIALVTSTGTITVNGLGELTFVQLLQEVPVIAIVISVLAGYTGDSITNKFSKMVSTNAQQNSS